MSRECPMAIKCLPNNPTCPTCRRSETDPTCSCDPLNSASCACRIAGAQEMLERCLQAVAWCEDARNAIRDLRSGEAIGRTEDEEQLARAREHAPRTADEECARGNHMPSRPGEPCPKCGTPRSAEATNFFQWAEQWCAAFNKWARADEDSLDETECELELWALRDRYEAVRSTHQSKMRRSNEAPTDHAKCDVACSLECDLANRSAVDAPRSDGAPPTKAPRVPIRWRLREIALGKLDPDDTAERMVTEIAALVDWAKTEGRRGESAPTCKHPMDRRQGFPSGIWCCDCGALWLGAETGAPGHWRTPGRGPR